MREKLQEDTFILDARNEKKLVSYIKGISPNYIINCIGVLINGSKRDPENAIFLNSYLPHRLSRLSDVINAKLIHISTDFIFDSNKNIPIKENETPNPFCTYAKSKYQGEQYILNSSIDSIIIRSSWIYSEFGNNFLKNIMKISKKKKSISVVNDQIGSPTYANDLAVVCILFVKKYITITGQNIFNYSNLGECSWYDFAVEIKKNAKLNCNINPIKTEDFHSLAKRPKYSVLDKSKIKRELGIEIPFWKDSLKICINKIIK